MEKFSIENKLIVEHAVEQAVDLVKSWTRQELENLVSKNNIKKKQLLILPLGKHGFIIGNYALKPVEDQWYMLYRYHDKELVFKHKNAAMFYAICQSLGNNKLAEQLLGYDQEINRLNVEADRLKQRIERKNKNYDLYLNRYYQTRAQLQQKRFLLEKSLKLAKYNNF